MTTKVEVSTATSAGKYYVEVDGPDGLKHHVGPFKSRSLAQEWIARQSFECETPTPGIANTPQLKQPP